MYNDVGRANHDKQPSTQCTSTSNLNHRPNPDHSPNPTPTDCHFEVYVYSMPAANLPRTLQYIIGLFTFYLVYLLYIRPW